jgi:hypothetical protein
MRMDAVMMRSGSNPYLTPARTGLILIALLLLGAITVRVIMVLGHSDVSTHTARESGGGVMLDVGTADLRGSLPSRRHVRHGPQAAWGN